MVKHMISTKRKNCLKNTQQLSKPTLKLKKDANVTEHDPIKTLLDENFIAKAVWECLKNNDPEGVVEIIETHIWAINKAKAAKSSDLPRSTLYNAIKGKNPTIRTLAKLINCCS